MNELSGNAQDGLGVMPFCHFCGSKQLVRARDSHSHSHYQIGHVPIRLTIKKFDNVRKVHVILENNGRIVEYKRQCNEKNETGGGGVLGRPDGLPHREDIRVEKLCTCVNNM